MIDICSCYGMNISANWTWPGHDLFCTAVQHDSMQCVMLEWRHRCEWWGHWWIQRLRLWYRWHISKKQTDFYQFSSSLYDCRIQCCVCADVLVQW